MGSVAVSILFCVCGKWSDDVCVCVGGCWFLEGLCEDEGMVLGCQDCIYSMGQKQIMPKAGIMGGVRMKRPWVSDSVPQSSVEVRIQ